MGSGGSKPNRYAQKPVCHVPEGKVRIGARGCEDFSRKRLEEQKVEYELQYKKLEQDHLKLQNDFLELKAKYDQDIMNAGDFASHANEINKKLENAFLERSVPLLNDKVTIPQTLKICEACKNCVKQRGDMMIITPEESTREKIDKLQKDLERLLTDNADKEHEIDRLRKEIEVVRQKAEEEKNILKEEFTTKGLLLCERYEEEKKEMNSLWEDKLTYPYSEVINNCNQDMTTFRTKLNREKSALEEKLESAMSELTALEKKNKFLNNLFEDIRIRYESRESRTEDLERIADLEGQLILQAEELEKQKETLRNMKSTSPNTSECASGPGRRSKKNAKKRKKRTQVEEVCGSNGGGSSPSSEKNLIK